MDIERPHRTTSTPTTTSELFICFTSRLSKSSSMRLSSKSIQSPAHPSDPKSSQPHSLSTSLSRRLRHNRSLRGGAQSPAMFPSSSSKKNRGSSSSGFAENPEPSSPKVTCIGQVRVKTKKQGKKMKMRACRSKRLSGGGSGDVSFRRIEHSHEGLNQNQQNQECGLNHHRNQRWVHLPLTICEALRAFGSEFSCLFPCKPSCFSSGFCGGEKGGKERESSANSCAVFRWLVSLQDGEEGGGGGGKRRDIELVVGGEEEVEGLEREGSRERVVMERECSRRRSIFDDMEFDDLFENVKSSRNGSAKHGELLDDEEEGEGRVSICVPPKNALLLMRCRSDPIKMASLSHRLWDPPLPQDVDDDDEVEVRDEVTVKLEEEKKTEEVVEMREEFGENNEELGEMLEGLVVGELNVENLPDIVGGEEKNHEELQETGEEEEQSIENRANPESEHEKCVIVEETQLMEDVNNANGCFIESITEEDLVITDSEIQREFLKEGVSNVMEQVCESNSKTNSIEEEKEGRENAESSTDLSTISSSLSSSCMNSSEESTAESKEEKDRVEFEPEKVEEEKERKLSMEEKPAKLPDCLLLMMCEPKLSMEVSKETWVCSTDFIRRLPERHQGKKGNGKMDGSDDAAAKKKKLGVAPMAAEAGVQPGRLSISFPAGTVGNLIERKLVKAGGYEPLVLPRCKSAPIRSTGKVAAPEMACGRKLEPHRPATFGVGF